MFWKVFLLNQTSNINKEFEIISMFLKDAQNISRPTLSVKLCHGICYSEIGIQHTLRREFNLYFCMSQVSLLVVMEIGLFPLICGWWLDICSLVRQLSVQKTLLGSCWCCFIHLFCPQSPNGWMKCKILHCLKILKQICSLVLNTQRHTHTGYHVLLGCRRCSTQLLKTGSRVLTWPPAPPCSSTGWSAWSTSSTSRPSSFCSERSAQDFDSSQSCNATC